MNTTNTAIATNSGNINPQWVGAGSGYWVGAGSGDSNCAPIQIQPWATTYAPQVTILGGHMQPNKVFKKKEPYVGFARDVLRDIDLSGIDREHTQTPVTILDDEGVAWVLAVVDGEVKVNWTEGKWIHPAWFRVASFPRVRSEDADFVPTLEDYAYQEAAAAIQKQEDQRLMQLLDSSLADSDGLVIPYKFRVSQYQYDKALGEIRSAEIEPHNVLVHPRTVPSIGKLRLRDLDLIESVVVPEGSVYITADPEYLGYIMSLYGVRKAPNPSPERFFLGAVLEELIGMAVLNPAGVVKLQS